MARSCCKTASGKEQEIKEIVERSDRAQSPDAKAANVHEK